MKTIGPSFIALQVSDLEASARFYTEELGLDRVAQSPPGAVVFATTPIPFALRVPSVDLSEVDHLGWGVALWLKADDPAPFTTSWRRPASPSSRPPSRVRSG